MAKGSRECYVIDNDILYAVADGARRLVVPMSCRPLVMHLAHTVPWAGHLGRQKTYLRIASRFYWPSMYADVQNFCKTCPTCQKTSYVRQSDRALLQPLPMISTPFRRIAMDIVGPLVRSSGGHQYILVLCDYATRFPEAFPLRTVTALAVLCCRVQLFSRVGVHLALFGQMQTRQSGDDGATQALRHIIPLLPKVGDVRQLGQIVRHHIGLASSMADLEMERLEREIPAAGNTSDSPAPT
ncbi:protein NYNRIN-like isoform X2 [Boleophthalmus pectinirostris]|uniref:protein NYNRIN-like isoform X2 n=1 Tax=Boleophthalmus pectinirostris TaxID=150288 RepID=UPI00242A646A|nr:protein NYNRIN-like isoform X2 [Boleophthalmus pectinirostris]